MTHKERIGWFLALQRIIKLSKNRIAPSLSVSKKQSKLTEGETSGSTSVILRHNMSFVSQAKLFPLKQSAISYRRDNAWTQGLNGSVCKSAFSPPMVSVRESHTQPKPPQSATKLDRQLIVIPPSRQDLRRQQGRMEQLTSTSRLPWVRATGSASLIKTSFAPRQAHPPPPLYVNEEMQKGTPSATFNQTESLLSDQISKKTEAGLKHSVLSNSNSISVSQEKEAAVNQDQAPADFNTSASTLHLDGTSLGRWAVQHLERVLSKPPSGITGVDPRATIPRSRVAPF